MDSSAEATSGTAVFAVIGSCFSDGVGTRGSSGFLFKFFLRNMLLCKLIPWPTRAMHPAFQKMLADAHRAGPDVFPIHNRRQRRAFPRSKQIANRTRNHRYKPLGSATPLIVRMPRARFQDRAWDV